MDRNEIQWEKKKSKALALRSYRPTENGAWCSDLFTEML